MLLDFRTSNYKSFKEELVFSMAPAQKQTGLSYSIQTQTINKKEYKALSSCVIYGANASGKSNIIGALDTFKEIILRGNIKNSFNIRTGNVASQVLELIPNTFLQKKEPVSFEIKFVTHSLVINYGFTLDLGLFLDGDYSRKILKEFLNVNEEKIFSREQELEFGKLNSINDLLVEGYESSSRNLQDIAKNNLDNEELFLLNGFKAMFSPKLVSTILQWFKNKLIVAYRADLADAKETAKTFTDPDKIGTYIEGNLNFAANTFGVSSNAVGFRIKAKGEEPQLCSLIKANNKSIAIPAEAFESYGTIRFINLFPLIAAALQNGGSLIVDEFDASIHPMAIMNIINIFHNDEININHAQLVFNTHNPIFLNKNIFRRDEIRFVERDEQTNGSNMYSLADFGTSGPYGVRKTDDYMKNYFIDKYGALKDIDFAPVFEKLLTEADK